MSKIENIVGSLEQKIGKLIQNLELIKAENERLSNESEVFKQTILNQQQNISQWEEKFETLQFANAMLGSEENTKETKLKINALIKEIDLCINQLSN